MTTPSLTHNFTTATDGTQLSYYSIGTGPGIVVVHGAMSFALTHKDLAVALSPYYTVHIISRRTRGLSGPYPPSITNSTSALCINSPTDSSTAPDTKQTRQRTYSPSYSSTVLQTDVSDLHSFITATSAQHIISISSGALITLSYLLTYPPSPTTPNPSSIQKTILFEPPLAFTDLPIPARQLNQGGLGVYEERRAAGDTIGALVAAMKVTGMVSRWVPDWLARMGFERRVASQRAKVLKERADGKATGEGDDGNGEGGNGGVDAGEGVNNFLGLVQALRYDFCVGEGMVGDSGRFRAITGEGVLLMGGTESQGYLKEGMDVLGGLVEGSRKVVIQGVGHNALVQRERGGKPEAAVEAIREFFGEG